MRRAGVQGRGQPRRPLRALHRRDLLERATPTRRSRRLRRNRSRRRARRPPRKWRLQSQRRATHSRTAGRHLGGGAREVPLPIARILQDVPESSRARVAHGGKPIKESRDVDLRWRRPHFFYYAGWADKLEYAFPDRRRDGRRGRSDHPWNFPLLMLSWKIAPAWPRATPSSSSRRRRRRSRHSSSQTYCARPSFLPES